MNTVSKMIVALAITFPPVLSFAQATQTSSVPVTHASLQAELAALYKAGYQPIAEDSNYPADIQAAEAKLAHQHAINSK